MELRTLSTWRLFILEGPEGPVVAATHYVRAYADQIARTCRTASATLVLVADCLARSDTRANLRRFFEVDRNYIAQATVDALVKEGKLTAKDSAKAIPNPAGV